MLIRRAAAWAAWAAWTCKEQKRSLLPDAPRLVDREAPGGKLPGVFSSRMVCSPLAAVSSVLVWIHG
jgi:hypothetical protein